MDACHFKVTAPVMDACHFMVTACNLSSPPLCYFYDGSLSLFLSLSIYLSIPYSLSIYLLGNFHYLEVVGNPQRLQKLYDFAN